MIRDFHARVLVEEEDVLNPQQTPLCMSEGNAEAFVSVLTAAVVTPSTPLTALAAVKEANEVAKADHIPAPVDTS